MNLPPAHGTWSTPGADGRRTFTLDSPILIVGDAVRVWAYGEGARRVDVGLEGTVVQVNRTRVVVRFNVFSRSRLAISPACLTRLTALEA